MSRTERKLSPSPAPPTAQSLQNNPPRHGQGTGFGEKDVEESIITQISFFQSPAFLSNLFVGCIKRKIKTRLVSLKGCLNFSTHIPTHLA